MTERSDPQGECISGLVPRLLLSPTPSLSLPIPFSSHYAPQAGAAKRRYATGIGDERRRDPAWSDVSGSHPFLTRVSRSLLSLVPLVTKGNHEVTEGRRVVTGSNGRRERVERHEPNRNGLFGLMSLSLSIPAGGRSEGTERYATR